LTIFPGDIIYPLHLGLRWPLWAILTVMDKLRHRDR